jgi:serine acetyltransferase
MTCDDVVIENDVWIGLDAVILSGVRIRNGAVIGARSVVTRDVDAYSIVAGNPARKVRERFTRKQIDALQEIARWNWAEDKIRLRLPLLLSGRVDEFIGHSML